VFRRKEHCWLNLVVSGRARVGHRTTWDCAWSEVHAVCSELLCGMWALRIQRNVYMGSCCVVTIHVCWCSGLEYRSEEACSVCFAWTCSVRSAKYIHFKMGLYACEISLSKSFIIIFNLRTAAFKAYCAIWIRRSSLRHQASPRVSPHESSQRRKAELWARNFRKFCLNAELHVTFRDLLHAVKLRHGADGFTSPPKEGVLRIYCP